MNNQPKCVHTRAPSYLEPQRDRQCLPYSHWGRIAWVEQQREAGLLPKRGEKCDRAVERMWRLGP